MKELLGGYRKRLWRAASDDRIALALRRAIASYRRNTEEALRRFPHTQRLAAEVRRIKERSIERLQELVEEAARALRANHVSVHLAGQREEALRIVEELVPPGAVVVKAKSMTGEEIGLREHLEARGREVYETDLGEFILQRMGQRPMHILSPAIHVPKEEVARLLEGILGRPVEADIGQEVALVRQLLRDKYLQAQVGISGANVLAADTGSLFIIENEGNARLCTGFPPVHIALVGLEKLVATLEEAWKVAEVTWRFANYSVPSYLNVISGPSKTGDIEKVTTYGAHGPREVHVILYDGGRSRLAGDERFREALYCLRCGGCLYECPLFARVAGTFGQAYFGGIGAVWTAFVTGTLQEAAPLAFSCLGCGRCRERCPLQIDAPRMCRELRRLFWESTRGPERTSP